MSGNIMFSKPERAEPVLNVPRFPSSPPPDRRPAIPPRIKMQPMPMKHPRPWEHPPRLTLKESPPGKQSTDLARLLCESTLPRCIRLRDNNPDKTSTAAAKKSPAIHHKYGFNSGEVLMLHFIHDHTVVHARDSGGTELRLPIYAQQKYEILPLDPCFDDVEYNGTAELIDANPLPKIVRVLESHCSTLPEEDQADDDIIVIDGIDHDKERGKLVVGKCNGTTVRFSRQMDTSSYTTMLYPGFYTMSEIIEHKFPQRVRAPDPRKPFCFRKFSEEKVLKLEGVSKETCVVATRSGDRQIYSIPVDTPIFFQTVDKVMIERTSMIGLVSSLYPLVNSTWGLIDPTQEPLSAGMEGIPSPLENVLRNWFRSREGKLRVAKAAEVNLKELEEELSTTRNEMRRMRAPTSPVSPKEASAQPAPPCLPRRKRDSKGMEGAHAPSLPPRGREYHPSQTLTENAYAHIGLDNIRLGKVDPWTLVEMTRDILVKKEMELKKLRNKTDTLANKCSVLEKEKIILKEKADNLAGMYEVLPDAPVSQIQTQLNGASLHTNHSGYLVPRSDEPSALQRFSVRDVGKFLGELGLSMYADKFASNDIDGDLLVHLREDHMKELGMTGLHSVKLKVHIDKRLGRI